MCLVLLPIGVEKANSNSEQLKYAVLCFVRKLCYDALSLTVGTK